MMYLRAVPLLVFASISASAHTERTTHFTVEAAEEAVARQVAETSEKLRDQIARDWLGKEMPPWDERCPIRVTTTVGSVRGATTFHFDKGKVTSQSMTVEGSLEGILSNALPHEMTHVVLAHALGQPLPRWADEGAAVLAENDAEQKRHAKLVREVWNNRRALSMHRLFAAKEYPSDVVAFYAQGHSVTRLLVEKKDRPTFLAFLKQSVEESPAAALKKHYGYENLEALEAELLRRLRKEKEPR